MKQALINELVARKSEVGDEIERKEEELADLEEEMANIEALLDQYGTAEDNGKVQYVEPSSAKVKQQPIGIPKGKNSWDEYAKIVLKEIGGEGKSQEVIEYAKKANLRIKEKKIVDVLRGTLSKLGKVGAIQVKKGAIKSEGNVYKLLEQP